MKGFSELSEGSVKVAFPLLRVCRYICRQIDVVGDGKWASCAAVCTTARPRVFDSI